MTNNGGLGRESIIYNRRFSKQETEFRNAIWKVLCSAFFQKYVSPADTVVDVGSGDGLFITHIQAKRRIAVDLSPHVSDLTAQGIETHVAAASELTSHVPAGCDLIFMSNFLEHLLSKQEVLIVLDECRRALRPGGRLLILQPNIRYVGSDYWDYIDHNIALTEHSLREALDITEYEVLEMIPRFLPYTVKSRLGEFSRMLGAERLMRLYLSMPLLWRFFGSQTFVVARRPEAGD